MGYCIIKNITKDLWVKEENNGRIKHTEDENKAMLFYDEEDAESLLEYLNSFFPDFYTLLKMNAIG